MAWTTAQIAEYHNYAKTYIADYPRKIDCADLAIACLIDFAEKHGLSVSFRFYAGGWQWLRFPGDSDSASSFKQKAMRMLGALNIIDNTTAIPLKSAKPGDFIMTKWSASLGHTRVIYSVKPLPKSKEVEVVWYQGNLPPVIPEKRTAKFSEIVEVFGGTPRRWKFDQF